MHDGEEPFYISTLYTI